MQKYQDCVLSRRGPVNGAVVTVTTLAGAAATIYSDNGVTPITSQLTTDADGFFAFYAADGRYTVTISGAGISTETRTDILLEDQADGSAALAASGGAALVGWVQAGAGAVARLAQAKLRESFTPDDHGALGDDAANDGPALLRTLTARSPKGGLIRLLNKTYRLGDDGSGRCVIVTGPLRLKGEGGIYSALNPSGVGAGVDTIQLSPNPAYDNTLTIIEGVHLADPSTGTRGGNRGVVVLTTAAGQNLCKFTLRDMAVGQGAGWGVEHINDPILNINGGLYGGRIENSTIKGGVHLDNSGDSISVSHTIISGAKIGVSASLVTGASILALENNNITNAGGAVRIDAGSRFRILGNNCENLAAGAAAQNNGAVMNIAGANGTMYGGVIKENLVSAFGSSDATILLRLDNCRGTLVEDNVLITALAGVTAIQVESGCQDVRIGANAYNAAITTKIVDNGVGTMGVVKTAVLQNGWVAYSAGAATLKYIKSTDGMVHVYGSIKSGTTANGTLIATLPAGFRPSEIIRTPIQVINGGTPQFAEMSVEASGELRIVYALSSDQVNVNFTFPADNLANAVSLE